MLLTSTIFFFYSGANYKFVLPFFLFLFRSILVFYLSTDLILCKLIGFATIICREYLNLKQPMT